MSDVSRRDFLKTTATVGAGAALTQTGLLPSAVEGADVGAGSGNRASVISLPKGGGAIRGIGESFQPNLFTGTGNFSVPIFTSPGRNGFGPEPTLQYSSGNGNGPFGLGWQLSIPRITRKTEKGLPTYTEDDVFVISGAEDLVRSLKKVSSEPGKWEPDVFELHGYSITRYRPRTEGLFARIERWVKGADVHWRATTKENVTSIYGRSPAARIADPEDSGKVFAWLLEETFDRKGNHILYEYIHESDDLVLDEQYEHSRRYTQAYIRRILYGNISDNLPGDKTRHLPTREGTDHKSISSIATKTRHYVFQLLFDYGDLPAPLPAYESNGAGSSSPPPWWDTSKDVLSKVNPREDRFSTYRAGFEIRTLRLCKRALMLHHFQEGELIGAPLVKSTDFEYGQDPHAKFSYLKSVTLRGYRKHSSDPTKYHSREMPSVTFAYSEFTPQEQHYQSVTAEGNDYPPRSLDDRAFALLDNFGDGLPDIVHSTENGYYCWQNLGEAHIGRRQLQQNAPVGVVLSSTNVAIGDMGGDGLPDLVVDAPPMSGFYEATPEGRWKSFKRFEQIPSVKFADPNARLVDLTGDGLSDVLVTLDNHFLWFRCLGEAGYADPIAVPRHHDLDRFPGVYFSDPAGRVRLTDMTGDGLNDIVMVHDGSIEYWPNLGFGRFGKRVQMARAPRIGYGFDPERLFLVDLDGTGCADVVYVEVDCVHFWFNQSGNAFSEQHTIQGTPTTTDTTALQFTDFLGTGTACLVWSYDYGFLTGSNYRILDFCGGKKPHLLVEMSNNMGATTRAQYTSSTKFYLEDKKRGQPWLTNLPFPIQVLEKTEVIDHISKTKLVTQYKYHHGYYDGREFRGFGRVDQFDTEIFDDFVRESLHGKENLFQNKSMAFHVPPTETRTWFHTGIYYDPDRYVDHSELSLKYRQEYYDADPLAFELPVHELNDVGHDVFRALRGVVLRTEVYGRDETEKSKHPYSVTQICYRVKTLQDGDEKHPPVYLTTQKATMSYQYERNPGDPRISHSLMLEVDEFGNVVQSVDVAYGRRQPDPALKSRDQAEQRRLLITYTENSFTDSITQNEAYRTPLQCEGRSYELTGYTPSGDAGRFQESDFVESDPSAPGGTKLLFDSEIGYEDRPSNGKQRRLIKHIRTLYRPDDLGASQGDPVVLLPLRSVQPMALPGETYNLAFTSELLAQLFQRAGQSLLHPDPADVLGGQGPDRGGYLESEQLKGEGKFPDTDPDDYWWAPAGRVFFSPRTNDSPAQELAYAQEHFFLPQRYRDPFHTNSVNTETLVTYDSYDLLMLETRDPLGNRITAGERKPNGDLDAAKPGNDYRVLQPWRVMDANRNRTQVAFDVLGMVVGTAVMGKPEENLGDSLSDFDADLSETVMLDHLSNPLGNPHDILGRSTTRLVYDLLAYQRTRNEPAWQPPVVYTLAREMHEADLAPGERSKVQHSFSYFDGFSREVQKKIQAEPEQVNIGSGSSRWVGSGWTIFNNKGKPVRQYEPFFTQKHVFEFDPRIGVSPVLFYDPAERVVATLQPNDTYEKVVFDPYQQTSYDANDTLVANGIQTGDPRDDPDTGGYVSEYFKAQPATWQTWHTQRISNQMGVSERDAAEKAAAHSDTPTTAYFDTRGRTFLTVAHNRFERAGAVIDEKYSTRLGLDIEGNQREVIDAKDRVVMRYDYDMLGNLIHQTSMDAGERWILSDVTGNSIRSWDSRGHAFRSEFDPLRRPTGTYVTGADPRNPSEELLVERLVYGEQHPQDEFCNLRGKLYLHLDQAGAMATECYDFKGNPLHASRGIATEYKQAINWKAVNAVLPSDSRKHFSAITLESTLGLHLEQGKFSTDTTYDALNRAISVTTPDGSLYRRTFNDANLLEKVDVNLRGELENGQVKWIPFVTNISYNAKGQRERIEYGSGAAPNRSGVTTTYEYDEDTFRLIHLKTTRPLMQNHPASEIFADSLVLQDLHYTYDPVGNITRIEDAALKVVDHNNQRVEPVARYRYDSVYRLIEATGREHIGQTAHEFNPPHGRDYPFAGLTNFIAHPHDIQKLRNYTQTYHYDAAGNIERMNHSASGGGWKRHYDYEEDSLTEAPKKSNRLTKTTLGNGFSHAEVYTYRDAAGNDVHGCMTAINNMKMVWDFKDQMQQVDLGGGGIAYYVYDGAGQRVRKVIASPGGTRQKEVIYLGTFEVYREYHSDGETVVLSRDSLHIMDDKQRIALVESRTQGNEASPAELTRYQLGNHLGSASVELDEEGALISYEEYHPYGTSAFQAGRSAAEINSKRYRYTGKERDPESGFSYHGARYYSAWLGRWTNTDPWGHVDGLNLYRYARDNPALLRDSTGTRSEGTEDSTENLDVNYRKVGGTKQAYDAHVREFGFPPPELVAIPGAERAEQSLVQDKTATVPEIDQIAQKAGPAAAEMGIRASAVGVARAEYHIKSFHIPTRVQASVGSITSEAAANQAIELRRNAMADARAQMPRAVSELSAARDVRKYSAGGGDALGYRNAAQARAATGKTNAQIVQSAGRPSAFFTGISSVVSALGAALTVLWAYGMAKSHTEKGHVPVAPGVSIITDPSKIKDGTRVWGGKIYGGQFVPDPM